MENWRNYLKEDEKEEFGPSFEEDIKECDRGMQLGGTLCLVKKGYKMLGEGSFRDTLALPGNDQYVLKVATNKKGLRMNELEADFRMQRNYAELVPKTYGHAKDYRWVVIERVNPWKGNNEAWIKAFFPAFADMEYIKQKTYYPTQSVWEFFKDVSEKMVENIKEGDEGKDSSLNIEFVTPEEGKGKNNRERREMGYERRVEFEKTLSPFYKRFIDLAAEYNIEFWDIVDRNVGTRDDDSFVILDLSVFEEGASFG
tara:strand:- start:355 stop:1122 length:768 start_codon:yes stop_codon:yes gene_type:complete